MMSGKWPSRRSRQRSRRNQLRSCECRSPDLCEIGLGPCVDTGTRKERDMAEITAATGKAPRERTGAGMMDCKKALAEANGEMETAIDWLRAKGLAAAAKKAGRTAAEGLVGVAVEGNRGAVAEVNSETDFVAK